MTLRYHCADDGVAEITLGHPPVNALLAALDRAAQDPQARVVILAIAMPRRFCAGLGLAALADAPPGQIHSLLDKLYTRLVDARWRLGKPSIAAIGGAARGGGMTLAISCDLLFTGRSFSADEALNLGLVSRVVDVDAQLMDQARALARQLAAKSPASLRLGREAFLDGMDTGYRQGVAGAVQTFCHVALSEDGREGVRALAEKREPRWGQG